MEKIIFLGTGNASVTRCYNTCFAIENKGEYFLIDAGGGNGILTQLETAGIPLASIHHMFISHEHTDHLLGAVWMIRMVVTAMRKEKYIGNMYLYCHEDLVDTICTIARLTLPKKFFSRVQVLEEREVVGKTDIVHQSEMTGISGVVPSDYESDYGATRNPYTEPQIFLVPLKNKDVVQILDYEVMFFDICSDKAKQYGFTMKLQNGKKFTFIGDEYYRECEYPYAKDADWLLHEAFCLYRDRDIFEPYEKFHATVKEACENATMLGVKNLILYHTEDKNLTNRKKLYTEEGRAYFKGNLLVPDDLDEISLG